MIMSDSNFNIDFDSEMASVNFNKLFYSKRLLLEVCSEFTEIFYFVLNESDNVLSLDIILRAKEDFKDAIFEFFNFLIGLQVSSFKK